MIRRTLVVGRQVGIAQGHFEIFVPQEFLHRHQIYTGHDQVRGEGIPQVMEDKALDSGLSKRLMKPLAGAIDVIISLVDPGARI